MLRPYEKEISRLEQHLYCPICDERIGKRMSGIMRLEPGYEAPTDEANPVWRRRFRKGEHMPRGRDVRRAVERHEKRGLARGQRLNDVDAEERISWGFDSRMAPRWRWGRDRDLSLQQQLKYRFAHASHEQLEKLVERYTTQRRSPRQVVSDFTSLPEGENDVECSGCSKVLPVRA